MIEQTIAICCPQKLSQPGNSTMPSGFVGFQKGGSAILLLMISLEIRNSRIGRPFYRMVCCQIIGMARLRGYWKSSSDSENSEGDGEVSAAGNERAGKVSAVGNELNEIQEVAG